MGGPKNQPKAVIIDSRTLQSTPESGARAGWGGAKRRRSSKVHIAIDTLGHLLTLKVTAADEGKRAQVATLAEQVQAVTGGTAELAYVDQGYSGPAALEAAQEHEIHLEVVKHSWSKVASCCCLDAGSSSEASAGPRASAWPATMKSLKSPSEASTCLPSPALCSATWSNTRLKLSTGSSESDQMIMRKCTHLPHIRCTKVCSIWPIYNLEPPPLKKKPNQWIPRSKTRLKGICIQAQAHMY